MSNDRDEPRYGTRFGIMPQTRGYLPADLFGRAEGITPSAVRGLPSAMRREAMLILREAGLDGQASARQSGLPPTAVAALLERTVSPYRLPGEEDDSDPVMARPTMLPATLGQCAMLEALVSLTDGAILTGPRELSAPRIAEVLDISCKRARAEIRALEAQGFIVIQAAAGRPSLIGLTSRGRIATHSGHRRPS